MFPEDSKHPRQTEELSESPGWLSRRPKVRVKFRQCSQTHLAAARSSSATPRGWVKSGTERRGERHYSSLLPVSWHRLGCPGLFCPNESSDSLREGPLARGGSRTPRGHVWSRNTVLSPDKSRGGISEEPSVAPSSLLKAEDSPESLLNPSALVRSPTESIWQSSGRVFTGSAKGGWRWRDHTPLDCCFPRGQGTGLYRAPLWQVTGSLGKESEWDAAPPTTPTSPSLSFTNPSSATQQRPSNTKKCTCG